jgi:hypothetical protein
MKMKRLPDEERVGPSVMGTPLSARAFMVSSRFGCRRKYAAVRPHVTSGLDRRRVGRL